MGPSPPQPSSAPPKLTRSASSLSRKSHHYVDTSGRNSSINMSNSVDEVFEEDDEDNNVDDTPEEDSRSINSIEREMTLKDRQDVSYDYNLC